ncbi:GNAT family N-acetyltransferase [Halomonas nitroreducens]|uniref:GNAT family N-acetyltransferase n=1 Tax=Halomonas nitroreducens TaxID=447425 RepID=A0A3S0HV19_9GAMM|nr:GNAT family N-acetyltransferase [Halomonas nitroreducens]RTR05930.1 GNAT family N-acetyltransferase [Halomonas nitroreducens]
MSDTPYAIRPIRAGDKPEWARLWQDYLSFYDTELPEAVYDSTFSRLLVPEDGEPRAFVVEVPNAAGEEQEVPGLVGLVHYLYHAHCWKLTPVCYLQDLFVDPRHRGQGLGRRLIERVFAQASEEEAPDVYWLTQDFNRDARRLYDRVGVLTPFIKYARPPRDA